MKSTFQKSARTDLATLKLTFNAGTSGERESATLVAGEPTEDDHYLLEVGAQGPDGPYDLTIKLTPVEYEALIKGEAIELD
jgi:hypothetical protein